MLGDAIAIAASLGIIAWLATIIVRMNLRDRRGEPHPRAKLQSGRAAGQH